MWFFDRLASFVTGLGTSRDKATTAAHIHVPRTKVEIDAAYRDNWIARKSVDIIPFDMLRAWRDWQADKKSVTLLETAEKELGLRAKLLAGLVRGRLYGGGAIVIGDGSPRPDEPLVIEKIGRGGIKYLHVLSRHELTAGEIDRDLMSPHFGEPSYYEVRSSEQAGQRIHPSRVIRFLGAPVPDGSIAGDDAAWSDSILQAIFEAVNDATSVSQHLAAMLPEAKQDIVSVPGLSMALSDPESRDRLINRFIYAAQLKSMFGLILLEGDGTAEGGEVYQQKQLSFQHLPEVARLFLQIASGAADIPVTRFLGQSPAGLNTTGESDLANYYDHVAAKQNVELTPTIASLDRVLMRHALGEEPGDIWYRWSPLMQLTEVQKADAGLKRAQAFKIDAESGLIPDRALSKGRIGQLIDDGVYPGFEAAIEDAEDKDDELDFNEPAGNDNDPPDEEKALRAARASGRRMGDFAGFITDARPMSLYVSRRVLNAGDVIAWAKAQGFKSTLPSDDLHVTVCFSRAPLDWMKIEPDWASDENGGITVPAGGARLIERFGDAVVLLFSNWRLTSRHSEFIRAGASHDFDDYQPHVTLTYEPGDLDLRKVEPYQGKIVLGPELFAEVKEDWRAEVEEV